MKKMKKLLILMIVCMILCSINVGIEPCMQDEKDTMGVLSFSQEVNNY